MKIAKIFGREIYDSRGFPTVECELILDDGSYVTASVPSGLSRGRHEAFELRDGGTRLLGKGVSKAIENIDDIIAPALVSKDPDLVTLDLTMIELDGTIDKSKLGANAMLAVSIAILRAQSTVHGLEPYELVAHLCDYSSVTLPFPMFNVINGGAHADNNLRIQEYMIIPVGMQSFRACMEAGVTAFHTLKTVLKKHGKSVGYGDEGGYVADFKDDREALDYLMEAIEKSQKLTNARYLIALDVAASQFYNAKKKIYLWNETELTSADLIELYKTLTDRYPIFSIEDGLAEDDWQGWIDMSQALGEKIQIVGDDLCATHPELIAKALEMSACTGTVIKPNQIGTVTEALQSIKLCKENEMTIVASHRSGETNDNFIVELAVGTSVNYIKAGGCSRGERIAKYNELLRIEDTLLLSLLNL